MPGGHLGDASSIEKAKRVKPLNRDSKERDHIVSTFAAKLHKLFQAQAKKVAASVVSKVSKAEPAKDPFEDIDWGDDWQEMQDLFGTQIALAAKLGTGEAYAQINLDDPDILELANEDAIKFASERGAELVGKRITADGDVIDNPNADYAIDESTRDMLRGDITEAMEQGLSNDNLAQTIEDSYAFSSERAMTIARTETAFADCQGNMALYTRSEQVSQKQWITGADCCPDCQELEGEVVGLEEKFSNGVDAPPAHPNCRCDFIPILKDNEPDQGADE